MSTIPIIIPSYEPDERLIQLLKDLHKENLTQIVIVDDGSAQEYQSIFETALKEFHVHLIHHKINLGKGCALKTACDYCKKTFSDLTGCITADSDGQHSPASIKACIQALEKNPDSLIMGHRDFTSPDIPKKSLIGNNNTNKIFRSLYGKELKDTQTGLRGIPAGFIPDLLKLKGKRFEYEMQMLICAYEKNIQIVEVPIETIYDSKLNHSTHFRPIVDTFKIYKVFGVAKSLKAIFFK